MTFNRIKKLIFLILFVFFTAGILVNLHPKNEVYPLFSWDLFSKVPNNETSYFLRITNFRGKEKDVILIGPKVEEYINIEYLYDYYWLVQRLGRNIEEGEGKDVKQKVDELFKGPASYDLVKIEYDPYLFVTEGEYINLEVIERFSSE